MEKQVRKLEFQEEAYIESAEKRFDEGDDLGALKMLNMRAERYDPSADAEALYGEIYDIFELMSLSIDAWFRFLDTCNEADFSEGYRGLARAFLQKRDDRHGNFYLKKYYEAEGMDFSEIEKETQKPDLKLVHNADGPIDEEESLRDALQELLRIGLSGDKETDGQSQPTAPDPESKNYARDQGLAAFGKILRGDFEGAASEFQKLSEQFPDDLNSLLTYIALLEVQEDREGALAIGHRLAKYETDSYEDIICIAIALRQLGLHEETYAWFSRAREFSPYKEDILWSLGVAAYKSGKLEEAIEALEMLTLLNSRRVVASYYLQRMRRERDGEERGIGLSYDYALPEEEIERLKAHFRAILDTDDEKEAERLGEDRALLEDLRAPFDVLVAGGKDEEGDELRLLAADAALHCRCDRFLRELLLLNTMHGFDELKTHVLRALIARNEENSFGVVMGDVYREVFVHELEIGGKYAEPFLEAYADVAERLTFVGEFIETEFDEQLLSAAEEVFHSLEEQNALFYCENQAAVKAVIVREARLGILSRSLEVIAVIFQADLKVVKKILDLIM